MAGLRKLNTQQHCVICLDSKHVYGNPGSSTNFTWLRITWWDDITKLGYCNLGFLHVLGIGIYRHDTMLQYRLVFLGPHHSLSLGVKTRSSQIAHDWISLWRDIVLGRRSRLAPMNEWMFDLWMSWGTWNEDLRNRHRLDQAGRTAKIGWLLYGFI